MAKEAAIRWTGEHLDPSRLCFAFTSCHLPENFGMLLSDCTSKSGTDARQVREALQVPDEYEDIL